MKLFSNAEHFGCFLLFFCDFLQWDDVSKLFIMIISMIVLWIFGLNLLICEIGERVTAQFEQFGMEFARCDWSKLPLGMQRMYLIFLLNTQQRNHIQSYGNIMYTRETFKQVLFDLMTGTCRSSCEFLVFFYSDFDT